MGSWAAQLPTGAFLTEQGSQNLPRWVKRADNEMDTAYLKRAVTLATAAKGRLAYRADRQGNRPMVGIIGGDGKGTMASRWIARKVPDDWREQDFTEWATRVGFKEVEGAQRQSRRLWRFEADAPDGAGGQQAAFEFKSGIVVVPATRAPATRTGGGAARHAWGAPREPAAAPPDPPQSIKKDDAASQEDKDTDATMSDVPPGTKREATGKEENQDKRAKLEPTPYAVHFTPVDCGGQGDCAYTSIAKGLHSLKASAQKVTDADFAPRGRLQASLRLLASGELRARPMKYGIEADSKLPEQVATAGCWADSTSLSALAHGAGLDLRIWAEAQGKWTLWHVKGKGGKLKVVWLSLRSQHYKWLKPETSLTPALCKKYMQEAVAIPPGGTLGLWGAGISPDLAALDLMGLASRSSSPATSSMATSISGRPSMGALDVLGINRPAPIDQDDLDVDERTTSTPSRPRRRTSSTTGSGPPAGIEIKRGAEASKMASVMKRPACSVLKRPAAAPLLETVQTSRPSCTPRGSSRTSCAARRPTATTSRSTAPTAAPSACGTKRAASSVLRDLGLQRRIEQDDLDEVTTKGQHLFCPCGWKPPEDQNKQHCWRKARTHWRHCQGCAPPKAQPSQKRTWSRQCTAIQNPRRRAWAWASFQSWRASLPARIRDSVCEPIADAQTSQATRDGCTRTAYRCGRCGLEKQLCMMRQRPCQRRTTDVSTFEWNSVALGRRRALHIQKLQRRCAERATARRARDPELREKTRAANLRAVRKLRAKLKEKQAAAPPL